jgi:hypothetical protein
MKKLIALVFALVALNCAAAGPRFEIDSNCTVSQSIVSLTNNAVATLFTNQPSSTKIVWRGVQNIGTNAALYLINSTNVSLSNLNGIVAGGVAMFDGLGTQMELPLVRTAVYGKAATNGTRVVVTEITTP